MELLTVNNWKIQKGESKGYLTAVLHLSPSDISGYNVCPMASTGCRAACLNTAGHGGMIAIGETTNNVQRARLRRTCFFFENRPAFMAQLVGEIRNHIENARRRDLIPVFRLNATSDLRWEIYKLTVDGIEYPNIFAVFPDIQFYDYTAIPNRRVAHIPNYYLTFSRKEIHTENDVRKIVGFGMNVAVVFGKNEPLVKVIKSLEERLAARAEYLRRKEANKGKPKKPYVPRKIDLSWIPDTYAGWPTFIGDDTDLRFLDPKGVVVALAAKGEAKYDNSGFVVWVKVEK